MNIQQAIKSKKPFRRSGWTNNDIFVIYLPHDIVVLTFESDPPMSIELDVQDILANDWYIREDFHESFGLPDPVLEQPMHGCGMESAK